MRAGQDTPSALPHIEIDVFGSKQVRRRAAKLEDVDRLIEVLLEIITRGQGAEELARTLFARTENIPEISQDPDFWPRVVLDVSGKPFIRARYKAEARLFAELLAAFLEAGAFRDYSGWISAEIPGGTSHMVQVRCRESSLHRLAAKVTFGLIWLGSPEAGSGILRPLRQSVLGHSVSGKELNVHWISGPNSITAFPDYHAAIVIRSGKGLYGITSFFGDCSVVELTLPPDRLVAWEPVAGISRKDGTKTELVSGMLMADIAAALTAEAKDRVPGL